MLTLLTLGGLRLENGAELPSARATQRRRLALLALLALAPGRRLARGRLVAYLWSEASEEQARARLSAALYDLRQLLGDSNVVSEGDDVRLVPDALALDVDAISRSVDAGNWEDARRAWTGAFLDGVYIADAPLFEEWVASTRDRLERLHRTILEHAANECERTGDASATVERLRELSALDPLDVRTTRRLMEALDATGDRAGAIRVADESSRMLREELNAGPDSHVSEYAESLRRGEPRANGANDAHHALPESAVVVAAGGPRGTGVDAVTHAVPRNGTIAEPPRIAVDRPTAPPASPRPRLHRRAIAGAVMVAILAVALVVRAMSPGSRAVTADQRVLFIPFQVTGAADSLGASLAGQLATAVDRIDGYTATARTGGPGRGHGAALSRVEVRALAQRMNADQFVIGTVTASATTWRIDASLFDRRTGAELAAFRDEKPPGAATEVIDDLTRQLVAAELTRPDEHVARVAALSTTSVAAVRAFIDGERDYRAGRFAEAVKAYEAALAADSTMALAHYRLSLAIMWGNLPYVALGHNDSLALRYASNLPSHERTLITAYAAWRRGDYLVARDEYARLTMDQPTDVDAWLQLGETFFHYNPTVGHQINEARARFEAALELDSALWSPRWHLALLDGVAHGRAAFLAWVPGLLALSPDSVSSLGVRLVADGDSGSTRLRALARSADDNALMEASWRRAVFVRDLAGAADLYRELASPSRNEFSRAQGAYGLAVMELAHGRFASAERLVAAPYPTWVRTAGLVSLVQAAVATPFAASRAELEALSAEVVEWRGRAGEDTPTQQWTLITGHYLEGLLWAARDDGARALASAARIAGTGYQQRQARFTIRALLAARAGRSRAALALLDSASVTVWFGNAASTPSDAQSFQRFLRAECLRELGQWQEAIRWYDSFEQYTMWDVAWWGPVLLGRAAANDSLGRHDAARADRARFAELWRSSDPRYQQLVAGVAAAARPASRSQ